MSEITNADKLACARRELAMRKNVYPKWVGSGRMKQEAADRELKVMAAIVDDYEHVTGTTGGTIPAIHNQPQMDSTSDANQT